MIDGILIVDKQEGITSYDVIRKIKRKALSKIKIGHAGTLDPFATGMLIILLGKGTKLMDSFHTLKKEYVVKAKLGIKSDTQDITAEVIQRSEIIPSYDDLVLAIENNLKGEIDQMPPHYSAKKVNGRKAYDLAREGKDFELRPKRVTVYDFDILNYDYPDLGCKIVCSSGTYIRTLINDLGDITNALGTANSLKRNSIGDFKLEDGIKSDDIENMQWDDIEGCIIPLDKVKDIIYGER